MLLTRTTLLLLSLAFASSAAAAPSPVTAKREQDRVAKGAARVAKDCGCSVKARVDTASFPDDAQLLGAGMIGDDLADAAHEHCATKAGRAALCAGLAELVVGYAACPAGSTPTPPAFKDKVLRVVRCAGTGVSARTLTDLFAEKLPQSAAPVGDTDDEADAAVATTVEMALASGGALYPPGASTDEKESITEGWTGVAAKVDAVVASCRSRPRVLVDWASFAAAGEGRRRGPEVCGQVVAALTFACDGDNKAKVAIAPTIRQRVRVVRCHYDPSIKPDDSDRLMPVYSFKDGVFDVGVKFASDGWLYGSITGDGGLWLRAHL